MTTLEKPLVIVTGSSGLIGTRVIQKISGNYRVVGLDLKPSPETDDIAEFIECDLTSESSLDNALERVRDNYGKQIASVVHLAAWYDFSGEPSDMYQKLTVGGTSRLLKKLQEFDAEQFVFSSSILVMEPVEDEDETITEKSQLEDEPWPYPQSKIEAEQVIERDKAGIPAVILRIAGVYTDECNSIPIAQQISRIYEKKFDSFFFPGDASHGQPFIHLDDLVDCITHVIERRSALKDDLFLIAEPQLISYEELQEDIGTLLHGKEWPAIRVPKAAAKAGAWVEGKLPGKKEAFIKPWMIDLADAHYPVTIDRARHRLQWQPKHSLKDTLPRMVSALKRDPDGWYKKNGLAKQDKEN